MNTQFKQVTKEYDDGYSHGSIMDLHSEVTPPASLSAHAKEDWLAGAFQAFKDRTL